MPLQATSGAASYDAFGGGVAAVPNFIEDVFSTWLYTGNGSTQTINNGIDLAGKGGLVWLKQRSPNAFSHILVDTARGAANGLSSNTTAAQFTNVNSLTAFNSNGFTLNTGNSVNQDTDLFASWTFRKQPKFFDVVTFTTNASGGATVPHNLGSTPGFVIAKSTSGTSAWTCWHRDLTSTNYEIRLNSNAAQTNIGGAWITPSSTDVVFSSASSNLNASESYVAYLFAHNAGGFGLSGSENVVSCGSFTMGGSGSSVPPLAVNLGYEPQWLMIKRTDSASAAYAEWRMADEMRGWTTSNYENFYPSGDNAENTATELTKTSTGFIANLPGNPSFPGAGATYIYIAIRRGPMKVPTTGTSVYTSASRTGTAGVIPRWTAGFPVDWALRKSGVTTGGSDWQAGDRLRGAVQLKPNLTELETASSLLYNFSSITGYSSLGAAGSDTADRSWMFQRAPGFFDVVCYTGTGSSGRSVPHNLTVVPELMIVKSRSGTGVWRVYAAALNSISEGLTLQLNTTAQADFNGNFFGIPTSSSIILNDSGTETSNQSGVTYVAYLFASAPGVSKCGLYTGNGSSQTINCGFTGGARFVLVKRTNSTGNWLVVDTARGLVSAGDPTLYLNSTAAEVTGNDWIDPDSSGFIVNQTSTINANVNGGTYIFLAIA